MNTKKQAEAAGAKLLKKLKGKGWKIRVWENLGWHCAAHNGALTVHYDSRDGTHSCLLSDRVNDHGAGQGYWTENYYPKDPNKAVARQMKLAREFITKLDRVVGAVESRLL